MEDGAASLSAVKVVAICTILNKLSGIESCDRSVLSILETNLTELLEEVMNDLKLMASVSGRTVINVFDSDPILKKYSPQELIKYMHKYTVPAEQEYSPDVNAPEGTLKILKRPAEYTYKHTVTRAFRPDDPVAHQKSRAEQLHNIEINLRRRNAQFSGSSLPVNQRFVNFEY